MSLSPAFHKHLGFKSFKVSLLLAKGNTSFVLVSPLWSLCWGVTCLQELSTPLSHTSQSCLISSKTASCSPGRASLSVFNSPQVICITFRLSYSTLMFSQSTLTSEDSKYLCHFCMQQCAEQSLTYGKDADKHLLGSEHMTTLTLQWTPEVRLGGSKRANEERVFATFMALVSLMKQETNLSPRFPAESRPTWKGLC